MDEALAQGGRIVNRPVRVERDDPEGESSLLEGLGRLNRGIARGLTFGVGADTVSEGMRALGIEVAKEPAKTTAEHMIEGTGLAAGALPGVLFGAQQLTGRTAGTILAHIGKTILGPFYRAPITATVTELAAGAGAGGGRAAAEEAGRPELATIAEIGGGMAGGVGVGVPLEARRLILQTAGNLVRRAYTRTVKSLFPFTEAGAKIRASQQLRGLVQDPAAAAELVKRATISGLSPAQRTGENNLIALERVVMNRSAESGRAYNAQLKRSEQVLREAATDIADVSGLEGRVIQAQERANSRLINLTPARQAEQASSVYHQELTASLSSARKIESGLWDIPNIRLETSNLRRGYAGLEAGLPKAQADDMPVVARRLLAKRAAPPSGDALIVGPYGETLITKESAEASSAFRESEPVKELHGFFSQMREDARAARAAGQWNKARIADELADAAWLDLTGAAESPTAVGAQLQAAREYSRQLNQVFRQGEVGKLLGYARTGERRAQPTEALEMALGGRGGAQAGVMADELTRAAQFGGGDPAVAETAIQDYLKRRFILAAHFDPERPGVFSATAVQTFLRNNEQLLGRYPGLQKNMEQAFVSMESASKLQNVRKVAVSALQSQTPRNSLRRAMQGLPESDKAAVGAALLEHGLYSGGRLALDEAGQPLMIGSRLKGLLANPKIRGAYEEVFDAPAMQRLTRIADELAIIQKAVDIPLVEVAEIDKVAQGITYLGGTLGARIGSQLGKGTSGASLRTASKLAAIVEQRLDKFMNRHATKLLQDASTDPELYRALLTRIDAPTPVSESALRRISGWARQTAIGFGKQVAIPTAVGTAAVGVSGLTLPAFDPEGYRQEVGTERPRVVGPTPLEEALAQGGKMR